MVFITKDFISVVICFQISIFEPLETTNVLVIIGKGKLWFAFKLVSLNHWKQRRTCLCAPSRVVICFQISIFEPLETTPHAEPRPDPMLWFAFKLVSLNHWKQPISESNILGKVVICFQISIFEPLETTCFYSLSNYHTLWFAFKLVSLNHWKQHAHQWADTVSCCDLLSN